MRPATLLLCATALLSVVTATTESAQRPVTLTKKQLAELSQEVVPAYRLGNQRLLLDRLAKFVSRLDESRLAAADKLLAAQKIPSIGKMLADSRLAMIHQSQTDELPAPYPFELLVTLRALNERIDETLAQQDQHPLMSDPLPAVDALKDYEKLFWEIHVLDNRLANASRVARYAGQFAASGRKKLNAKSIDEADLLLINTDYAALVRDIGRRRRELEEREIEMRIFRIEDCESILANSNDDRERFLATFSLDIDGHLIADFFKRYPPGEQQAFLRPDLADESLPEQVQLMVQHARKTAGDLVVKANLFYTGLHWWLRGRYGAGPEAFGLLKSRWALANEANQFPLYMPVNTPKPTDPVKSDVPVPHVARRHHYTWATEYRPISSSVSSTSESTSTSATTSSVTTDKITQQEFFF